MDDRSLAVRLGLLIRQLRLAADLSQEAFADRCGLHRTYVGAIERGEKTISIETASKIADALELQLSELFMQLEAQPAIQYEAQPLPVGNRRPGSGPEARLDQQAWSDTAHFEHQLRTALDHNLLRGAIELLN